MIHSQGTFAFLRPYEARTGEADPLFFEVWRPVVGFEGRYDVSSFGRVRSLRSRWGVWPTPSGMRPVQPWRQSSGHLSVRLKGLDGVVRHPKVHTLVLESFVGPRPPGAEGCHFPDPDPANNRLCNLRWGTRQENAMDSVLLGRSPGQKLAVEAVRDIWARLVAGLETGREIAESHGVKETTISSIRTGQQWRHVTSKLPGWPIVPLWLNAREPVYIDPSIADSPFEHWMPVPWAPDHRVSSWGGVQSFRGIRHGSLGWTDKAVSLDARGYFRFHIKADGKTINCYVHALVLTAFACPRPSGMYGCHNDDDKQNNHASNLRWDTPKANAIDRERHQSERLASEPP